GRRAVGVGSTFAAAPCRQGADGTSAACCGRVTASYRGAATSRQRLRCRLRGRPIFGRPLNPCRAAQTAPTSRTATLEARLWHGFFIRIRSARSARSRVTPARAHEKEISFAAVLPAQKAPERRARTGRCPARTSSRTDARPDSGRTSQAEAPTREPRRQRSQEEDGTGHGRDEGGRP